MSTIKKYLSSIGKKGGEAGTGKAKARTTEQASAAAKKRWEKYMNHELARFLREECRRIGGKPELAEIIIKEKGLEK